MRHLLVLPMVLTIAAIAAPALAQDSGFELVDRGQVDQIQSSGGETGTEAPEGTKNCQGDIEHNLHSYPIDPCVRLNNPHYATDMGGGEVCTKRAKVCSSCLGCCDKQKV